MDSNQTEKTCGIIMICGYLGSGKTTLIQHILKHQTKYKIAVIQNEFTDGSPTYYLEKNLSLTRNGH